MTISAIYIVCTGKSPAPRPGGLGDKDGDDGVRATSVSSSESTVGRGNAGSSSMSLSSSISYQLIQRPLLLCTSPYSLNNSTSADSHKCLSSKYSLDKPLRMH